MTRDAESTMTPMLAAGVPQAGSHPADGENGHLEAHHGPPPFRRLLALLQPESRDLWTILVYAVGVGILSLAIPIAAAALVNNISFAIVLQPLIALAVALLVCLLLAAALRTQKHVLVEIIQQRIFVRVVADLASRLPRVQLSALDGRHGPELVNRFFDVLTVQKSAAALLLDGVALVLQTLVGLAVLAFYHHYLLAFDLALIAALVFMVIGLGRGAVTTAIGESRAKYEVASWIEELARHPYTFKLSGGADYALAKADGLAARYLTARRAHFRIVIRQFWFALLVQAVASAGLLALGGMLVIQGELSLGQLVAAELIVTLVVSAFAKFGKQLEAFYDLLAAVEKLGLLLDLPAERAGGETGNPPVGPARLRVHNVSFAYAQPLRLVLCDFNLEVKPGEHVALMGTHGAGKSTLVDLLFGLREPTQGHIELDGADLRELSLKEVRERIAVVKGIEIFEGTVLDNLRMGRAGLSIPRLRTALAQVGLLDDILDLPQGLNTPLGTGGVPLSYGQAQRLMLARAIAGEPRLLVVDEILDDLDLPVREQVLAGLFSPTAPWSLLLVTHTPDLARRCHRQVTLEKLRPSQVTLGGQA